ncbi:hypothetical protein CYU10_002278 [Lactococcus lactis subsp. lactis]|uniref:Uncharacterized protein n=1 Tax=Lactococcus lactis subsp. lactis TaxID=1360 RepID=A0A2R7Y0A1_LACLL|nr:hypothetical protein CYU10_002278 [Lactococcus lactis subsp. lactis]
MKLILSSILLGFGGFDPVGAVLIMAALANGAKKKTSIFIFFNGSTFHGCFRINIFIRY